MKINNLIYDLGMSEGVDTIVYINKGFKVIAVEANTNQCKKNTLKFKKAIDKNLLKIINIGIGETPCKAKFYINKKDDKLSSFFPETPIASHKIQEVQTAPLSFILKKYGLPFYLKSDIEGSDHLCLDALKKNYKPKYISLEGPTLKIIKKLKKIGYTKFKMVDQSKISPPYSSGNFGDNAVDLVSKHKWRTYNEVVESLNKYMQINKTKKLRHNRNLTLDIHATDSSKITLIKNKVPLTIKILFIKILIKAYFRKIIEKTDKKIGEICIFLKKKYPKIYYILGK